MALLWRVKYIETNIFTLLSNCTKSMLFFCAVLILEQRQSLHCWYRIYIVQWIDDRKRFEISCKINCIQYHTDAVYHPYCIRYMSTNIWVGSQRNERRPQFKLYRMVIESVRYVPTALLLISEWIARRVCIRGGVCLRLRSMWVVTDMWCFCFQWFLCIDASHANINA